MMKYLYVNNLAYPYELKSLYVEKGEWPEEKGNDSNLLIVFYVQIMPDDFVMQLHRF